MRRGLKKWRSTTKTWIEADVAALSAWTPVAIGVGVGFYFSLKNEPPLAFGLMALFVSIILVACLSKLRAPLIAIMLACLGFVAADLRATYVATPVLEKDIGIRAIEGRVLSIERAPDFERLVIAVDGIAELDREKTPARIRVSWRGATSDVSAGDYISLRAGLSAPPPPAAPGGFDFARRLYFERIGAVGFAVTAPAASRSDNGKSFRARIENARTGLTSRITDAAPGQGGAIVAALVTGRREAISEQSRTYLRDAGLAHFLAISGLHMGLATGLIFFGVRTALAAIEPLAIRYPIKKWAAGAALMSGFFYLLISGASWSPRRAFIMTAIMFIAILADRRAFSLRNVAIAATIILLTTPEALVHAGFQMSFAAVTGLIAVYEWWRGAADASRDVSLGARVKRYTIGLVVTDLVASLATAPFALYHFNRVAVFSLPANVLSMPIMAFWIMPAAVLGLLLAPFGLDTPAWVIAAKGVEAILAIGAEVSSWPGAVSLTPQWPVSALIAIVLGGLWCALARSPLRLAGVMALPIAVVIVASAPRPDLFVSATGKNVGVVTDVSGVQDIAAFTDRREKFSIRVWREAIGGAPDAQIKTIEDLQHCGAAGCIMKVRGKTVSMITARSALAEDCARADFVIAMFPVWDRDRDACHATIIDWRRIWDHGAHAVHLGDESLTIETVSAWRGERPWTRSEARR